MYTLKNFLKEGKQQVLYIYVHVHVYVIITENVYVHVQWNLQITDTLGTNDFEEVSFAERF